MVLDEEAALAAAAAALPCDIMPACDMLHAFQCHPSNACNVAMHSIRWFAHAWELQINKEGPTADSVDASLVCHPLDLPQWPRKDACG